MIGMPGHPALCPEGQQNLRSKFADPQSEFIDHAVEFLAMQLPVRVVEDNGFRHSQDLARFCKLRPTNFRQLAIGCCNPAMARRLTSGEAKNTGFNPAIT